MSVTLHKASILDAKKIYDLQIKSFKALLDKYQDYDFNPGAEKIERTLSRMEETFTDYYFISLDNKNIGAVRVCNFNELCIIKQFFIIPEYQGFGYAQETIISVEKLYPHAQHWELDTIQQEAKLCYLYEKMGYKKTGKLQNIKKGMDIVFYAK